MRQYLKLGVASAVTAAALFGGAPSASACSEIDSDSDPTNAVDVELPEQITCQVGEGNKSVTINQTNNISIGGDLDGDLTDVVPPTELD